MGVPDGRSADCHASVGASSLLPQGASEENIVENAMGRDSGDGHRLDVAGRVRQNSTVVDAAITAKVKTALLADPDVKALRIDVDTRDGIVTLNGSVTNPSNVERVASIATGSMA
jgi:osmotically-inducible protein OsmY